MQFKGPVLVHKPSFDIQIELRIRHTPQFTEFLQGHDKYQTGSCPQPYHKKLPRLGLSKAIIKGTRVPPSRQVGIWQF